MFSKLMGINKYGLEKNTCKEGKLKIFKLQQATSKMLKIWIVSGNIVCILQKRRGFHSIFEGRFVSYGMLNDALQ